MSATEEYAKERLQQLRKHILEQRGNLTDADRNILIEFDNQITRDRKTNNRCKWEHHLSLLSKTHLIATSTQQLAASLETGSDGEAAFDDIIDFLHEQDYTDYTMQNFMSALRIFANDVCDERPERFEQIEPGSHVEKTNPAPLPGEIVEYQHILAMVEMTDSTRDRALCLLQWDAGMRPYAELWDLRREHITFYDDYAIIVLPDRGKTDKQGLYIDVGFPALKKWVQDEHPVHTDPEAEMTPKTCIWTKRHKNEQLSYQALRERFIVAGDRANIDLSTTPQHLRRSSASILARKPHVNEHDLQQRYNWSPNSAAPNHYISTHATDTHLNVARARGREIEGLDTGMDTAPVLCERCADWTIRGLSECIHCSFAMDVNQVTFEACEKTSDPRADDKTIKGKIIDHEVTAEDLRVLERLEGNIKTNPKLFDELPSLIDSAERMEDDDQETINSYIGIQSLLIDACERASMWVRRRHDALTISPKHPGYPLDALETAGMMTFMTVYTGAMLSALYVMGDLQPMLQGEPTSTAAALIGLTIGGAMVARDLPTVDEAVEQLRDDLEYVE